MRMLVGMFFGALLITGVVYVADHWRQEPATTGSATATAINRPMVNWDVVSDNLHEMFGRTREGLSRLSHRITG